nr:hypothetical protein [Tanacetum cinerariifolium]
MDTTKAQQIALDDALVAPANHLKIRKCNHRLSSTLKSNKPTLQIYGAILPDVLTNQEMLDSKAYKEYYAVASRAKPPKSKTKYKKKADELVTSSKSKIAPASKGSILKSLQQSWLPREARKIFTCLTQVAQVMDLTRSKVPDEQQQKVTGINEGAGVRLEVLDVPKYALDCNEESWTFSQDEDDADEETYVNDDSEETESDNNGDNLTHPNLSTYKADDKEEEEEKAEDDDEVSSDHRVYTPPDHQLTDEDENQEGDDVVKEGKEEQEEEEEEELYGDLNINLHKSDVEMTDAQQENVQTNQVMKDTHFDQCVSTLEIELSEFRQTNQFAKAISSILGIVDNYLASKMKEAVDVAVQLQTNKLKEEAQAENQ